MRKYFGTDGIRGPVNGGKLTPELAMKVGMAAGLKFVNGDHRNRVVSLPDHYAVAVVAVDELEPCRHPDLHGQFRRQLAAIDRPTDAVGPEIFPHRKLPSHTGRGLYRARPSPQNPSRPLGYGRMTAQMGHYAAFRQNP